MNHQRLATQLSFGVLLTIVLTTCAPLGTGPVAPTVAPPAPASPTRAPTLPPTSEVTSEPSTDGADAIAAIQLVLDYYAAIDRQDYAQAYLMWADEGRASGQTGAEFAQGFSNTTRISVLLDKATVSVNSATVPITILSVLQETDGSEQAQRFSGTYTLGSPGDGWQFVGATITEEAGSEPPAETGDVLGLLQAYFQAINDRNYPRAYTFWEDNGAASQQDYTAFVQGFIQTVRVELVVGEVRSEGAAGSVYTAVPVVLFAYQQDGLRKAFCGTYELRRSNLPPFEGMGWRLFSAGILEISDVRPGSDLVQALLNGQCAAR